MIHTKPLFAALMGCTLVVSACTDVNTATNSSSQRTTEGVLIGGAIGAATGAILGDNAKNEKTGAVAGAILGAAIGGMIGANLDKQAKELQASLDDDIKIVNTGSELIVTMPQDILFAIDSDTVSMALQDDLMKLAKSLNKYPDTTVEVIGHTDNTGEASYNQNLSARRAQAVSNILVSSGVSSNRVRAFGRGEDEPIATNQTAEGRALNRRVDIVIRPKA